MLYAHRNDYLWQLEYDAYHREPPGLGSLAKQELDAPRSLTDFTSCETPDDPSTWSVLEVFSDGHAGIEYQYSLDANRISSDRFYCVNGHFYSFSFAWPISKPRPTAADRIINSFRIVNRPTMGSVHRR
jgi:hypothetical protein